MIRRSFPLVLSQSIFAIVGYILNVFLARHFGPIEYGTIGLALSINSLATVIVTSGVPLVISRDVARARGASNGLHRGGLRAQYLVAIVLMVLIAALAPLLQKILNRPGLAILLLVSTLLLPGYGLMTVLAGHWNGQHRFWRQSGLVVAYSVGKISAIVPLAVWFGPVGAMFGYVAAPLAGIVAGWRPKWQYSHNLRATRDVLRESYILSVFALTALGIYSIDLLMVAALSGQPTDAAYYVVGQSIALIPLTGLAAVSQVSTPTIARFFAADEYELAGRLVSRSLRNQLVILVPITAFLVFGAGPIVTLLYGPEFSEASLLVRALAPSYGIVAIFLFLSGCLHGAGASRTAVKCAIIGLTVTTATAAAFTPRLGPTGAAVGLGIGATLAMLSAYYEVGRVMPLPRWFRADNR